MKKILLTLLIVLHCNVNLLSEDEPSDESETKIEAIDSEEASIPVGANKKNQFKKNMTQNNSSKCAIRSERKLFINARESPILITVIDKNNKPHLYTLKAGIKKTVDHIPQHIKKIICHDKYQEKDIPITQATLNTFSVFIFSYDAKPEQLHFIDVKQKTHALHRAREALRNAQLSVNRDKKLIEKLIKKIEDIQEQTIYYQ